MDSEIDADQATGGAPEVIKCGLVCVHGVGNAGTGHGHMPRNVAAAVAEGVSKSGGTYNELPKNSAVDSSKASYLPVTRALIELPGVVPIEIEFNDGSWHRDTTEPEFRKVILWAFKVMPLFPYALAGFWSSDRASETRNDSLSFGATIGTLLILLLGLLTIPIVAALLVVGSFASLMSKTIKSLVNRVVVQVLGDAYLYMSGELDGREDGSIVSGLTHLTKSVAKRNDCTFLVGHSQGGEICRRISLIENVDGCAYIGSGEAPLSMLRIFRSAPMLPIILALLFIPFPALFAKAIEAMWLSTVTFMVGILRDAIDLIENLGTGHQIAVSDPFEAFLEILPYTAQEALWLTVFLGWSVATGLIVRSVTRRPDDLQQTSAAETMYIRSPVDPVSFGSLADVEIRRYVPISPARPRIPSLAKEHVTYFSKWQTGAFILELIVGTELLDMRRYELPKRFPFWVWVVATCSAGLLAFAAYGLGQAELSVFSHIVAATVR